MHPDSANRWYVIARNVTALGQITRNLLPVVLLFVCPIVNAQTNIPQAALETPVVCSAHREFGRPTNHIVISWPATPGKAYTVKWSATMSGPWFPLIHANAYE